MQKLEPYYVLVLPGLTTGWQAYKIVLNSKIINYILDKIFELFGV